MNLKLALDARPAPLDESAPLGPNALYADLRPQRRRRHRRPVLDPRTDSVSAAGNAAESAGR